MRLKEEQNEWQNENEKYKISVLVQ